MENRTVDAGETAELTTAALFAFPSAANVHAAAEDFPAARTAISSTAWRNVRERVSYSSPASASPSPAVRYPVVGASEVRGWAEGVFSSLVIGPGVVQLRRRNDAAADRARAAWADRHARAEALRAGRMIGCEYVGGEWYGWQIGMDRAEPNVVTHWSRKSRANLRRVVSMLDIRPLVSVGMPAMVTLTMPGNWEVLAPTAAAAAAAWNRFGLAWQRHFGSELRCIWKREFQRRGAPHWHLWTILGEAPADFAGTRSEWIEELQATIARLWVASLGFGCAGTCRPAPWAVGCHSCGERARALAASVRIDVTAGSRSRDPRRLATYFLKESLGGAKEYQNGAPALWRGSSVGRFWGTRGIEQVAGVADLDPLEVERVWRVLRGLRRSRRRRDGRKVSVRGRAGYVLVNDGPVLASQLARLIWQSRGDERDQLLADAAKLRYVDAVADLNDRLMWAELERSELLLTRT